MPIYEYECKSCGEKFELRRRMDDSDADIKCPQCGATHPKRAFSAFATGFATGSLGGACAPGAPT